MQLPDMNLLPALNALLREGSVTGAAAEMSVSASAMSRTLGRLRRVLGDPLLVPAGRGLALTPRALELRPQVEAALIGALAALQPAQPLDIASVARQFTVRTNDGLAVVIGPELTGRIAREAPGIRLRILPECEEDPADLRDRVDLDIGHLPELPHDVRSLELPPARLCGRLPRGFPARARAVDCGGVRGGRAHHRLAAGGASTAWSTSASRSSACGGTCWRRCPRR
ncbi:hypothetical protein GCM10020000_65470 [Streptomyces olivoverticillatus]